MEASRRSMLGLLAAVPFVTGFGPGRDDLQSLLEERAAADQFCGTVLLARPGQATRTWSYGLANRQAGAPVRAGTIFSLASVTKTFTAVAIAQLVERGRLAFHDPLESYVEGFPPVTIHQLLTHTSGLGRPALGPGVPGSPQWASVQEFWDGTMAIIRSTAPRFTPGTRHEYSNDGFFLLGEVVARVGGMSYYDYVRRNIFARAGMRHTDFYTRPQVLARDDIARPYWTQRDGTRADFTASPFFLFCGGPDSGAYSTVADMLAYARALRSGRLLGPALTELVTSGKVPVPPRFYGYGFEHTIANGHKVFGHSGSGPGRAANLDVTARGGGVAVILSNYDTTIEPIVSRARGLLTG
jgi:CubicO group peptidase (beta-lactamase class C family)